MDATMIPTIVELVKAVGFSALIFVIWIITLKFFEKILGQQKSYFEKIVAEQSKRNEENFQVLNKFSDAIEYLGGRVSETNSKVDNNHFCPIIRGDMKPPG
jgi:hypothetical protein